MTQRGMNHGDVRAVVQEYWVADEIRSGLHRVGWNMIDQQFFCYSCARYGCFHANKVQSVACGEKYAIPNEQPHTIFLNRG